jgi:hypothetical protein
VEPRIAGPILIRSSIPLGRLGCVAAPVLHLLFSRVARQAAEERAQQALPRPLSLLLLLLLLLGRWLIQFLLTTRLRAALPLPRGLPSSLAGAHRPIR